MLKLLLKNAKLADVVSVIANLFGITDLLGAVVTYGKQVWAAQGRGAVVRMVTIKEASLRSWAIQAKADPDNLVAKWKAMANAFADVIEAFFPKTFPRS